MVTPNCSIFPWQDFHFPTLLLTFREVLKAGRVGVAMVFWSEEIHSLVVDWKNVAIGINMINDQQGSLLSHMDKLLVAQVEHLHV
jgi:hypothetical protein